MMNAAVIGGASLAENTPTPVYSVMSLTIFQGV